MMNSDPRALYVALAGLAGAFLGEALHGGQSAVLPVGKQHRQAAELLLSARGRRNICRARRGNPPRRAQLAGRAQASNNSQQPFDAASSAGGGSFLLVVGARAGWAFGQRGLLPEHEERRPLRRSALPISRLTDLPPL
jgi:hypothetical protein